MEEMTEKLSETVELAVDNIMVAIYAPCAIYDDKVRDEHYRRQIAAIIGKAIDDDFAHRWHKATKDYTPNTLVKSIEKHKDTEIQKLKDDNSALVHTVRVLLDNCKGIVADSVARQYPEATRQYIGTLEKAKAITEANHPGKPFQEKLERYKKALEQCAYCAELAIGHVKDAYGEDGEATQGVQGVIDTANKALKPESDKENK